MNITKQICAPQQHTGRVLLLMVGLLLATSLAARGQSYVWSNFAGQPGGVGNVDGTGSAARFSGPNGVAVDSAGNVYVADSSNCAIRKISPAGVVTTLAGKPGVDGTADGTGSAARFNSPWSVALDTAGNLYVADSENHAIRKVTAGGAVTTLAGSLGTAGTNDGTGGGAQFDYPRGIAVDSAGTVYVADYNNCTIRQVTAAGVVTTLAGVPRTYGTQDGTGAAAQFAFPSGVVADNAGTLYVTDENSGTIRKVTAGGVVTTFVGDPPGSAARTVPPWTAPVTCTSPTSSTPPFAK